jgi:hypothetical protein
MNEEYLKLVKELQTTVKIELDKAPLKDNYSSNYPEASVNTLAVNIGIIIDDRFSVNDLSNTNTINPPIKLYWLQVTSYNDFEVFLSTRGIPAYISFDGDLGPKVKDGEDCAKLLVKVCKANKLKELPQYECHSPTLSKKQKIEEILLNY